MTQTAKTHASFRNIMITIVLLMGAMYAYMSFMIKTVPKTVTNSRAGPFVGLVNELLSERNDFKSWTQGPEATLRDVNARLVELMPHGGFQLRSGSDWTFAGWKERSRDGRPLLSVRMTKSGMDDVLLSFFPLAKRNFPKTGGFAEGQVLFFAFGRDNTIAQHEAHQKEIELLKGLNLNLVATNYGNDHFILMLSSLDAKLLAKELFNVTSIYQVSPGSF